jgi:hypothetical protein
MPRLFTRVRTVPNRAGQRELEQGAAMARDINKRGRRVLTRAVQGCPVSEEVGKGGGQLRASLEQIEAVPGRPIVTYIGSRLDYAIFVHEPTDPHPISPKEKAALWWGETMLTPRVEGDWRGEYDGTPIFIAPPWTRSYTVNHPGTKGQPFLTDALSAAK